MAKYDYGGGCPCGLYAECIPQCTYHSEEAARARQQADIWKARVYGKEQTPVKDPDDFGFTIVGEEDMVAPADDRAERLRDMVMPLLNNLKANPEKDIIKWAGSDRVKRINEFIEKMNKLVDG